MKAKAGGWSCFQQQIQVAATFELARTGRRHGGRTQLRMESRLGWVRDTVFYPCDQEYLNHGPGMTLASNLLSPCSPLATLPQVPRGGSGSTVELLVLTRPVSLSPSSD